jgi:hypothetical protein
VMIATIIAGFWSLACGQVVLKFAAPIFGI